MKARRHWNYRHIPLSIWILALLLFPAAPMMPVYAAEGAVYTAGISSVYRNPQTGVIEDSGGEQGAAIANSMVDGIIAKKGLLEVSDDGNYYLTIRMSLMEYTSGHNFEVQRIGETNWRAAAFGISGQGSDRQGKTADFVIQIPDENCVIRAGMYVEPMGRRVLWFIYPNSYVSGNQTDMKSTMIRQTIPQESQEEAGTEETAAPEQAPEENTDTWQNEVPKENGSGSNGQEETEAQAEAVPEVRMPETGTGPGGQSIPEAQGLRLSISGKAEKEEGGSVRRPSLAALTMLFITAGLMVMAVIYTAVHFSKQHADKGEDADETE